MKTAVSILALMLGWSLLPGCGGTGAADTCSITAVVAPATATADHALAPPGNQAQFSATSTVTGNCPMVPDKLGTWSTSDPLNTTISSPSPMQAVATCVHATSTPATISYSGTAHGQAFTAATLTCK
jgi:hypothetical protein